MKRLIYLLILIILCFNFIGNYINVTLATNTMEESISKTESITTDEGRDNNTDTFENKDSSSVSDNQENNSNTDTSSTDNKDDNNIDTSETDNKEEESPQVKQLLKDGLYKIVTGLDNNKVIEIDNGSLKNGANVQISTYQNRTHQKFQVKYIGEGYYTITAAYSGKSLDVSGAKKEVRTNVIQYTSNSQKDNQKWLLKDAGNGYFYIVSKCNGLYLDVKGKKTTDGTNIQMFTAQTHASQQFKFVPVEEYIGNEIYQIQAAIGKNKVLDVKDASLSNSANVQLWVKENLSRQKFKFTYVGNGYYTIKCINSGKVLDVAGSSKKNNANVIQYKSNGKDNQQWLLKDAGNGYFYIVSKYKGLYLNLYNERTKKGTNIEVSKANGKSSQKFKLIKVENPILETGNYGKSGLKIKGDSKGTRLKYYKIGNGENVLFTTFSIHGFEDAWNKDGKELTRIAEDFKNKLVRIKNDELLQIWTIYIFPSVNPDGTNYGYTNNGPGRTTLYSTADARRKGIDLNRCWHISGTAYTKYTSSRNYNGTAGFQAYEARYLRNFLLENKSKNAQTILIDLHGWLNETIGDNTLGSYYRSQFGISKHISTYGKGYLVNWARSNLGIKGKTARSALIELPEASNHNAIVKAKYSEKYINATINMLKKVR